MGCVGYLLPLDTRSDRRKSLRSGGQIGLHALECINRRSCTRETLNIIHRRVDMFGLHTFNDVQHRIA